MNSYNENLHLAIVNSLQSLDIEEQDLNSQVNAAMFTLYHAEGATIVAEQNLAAATDANNAVALTAQATEMEAETTIGLEYTQSIGFTEMLTRYANADPASLQQLFYHAYAVAKKNYTLAEKANSTTVKQLNMAKATSILHRLNLNSFNLVWRQPMQQR